MPWGELDEALVGEMTDVIHMKRELPVLQRGARWPLFADETAVVMARTDADGAALVGVNLADAPRTVGFRVPANRSDWRARRGGPVPEPAGDDGRMQWTIPPLSVSVAVAGP